MPEEEKKFINKHTPLTPEKLKEEYKQKEEAKKQYSTDAVELEKELDNFKNIVEPLLNPVTGKAMCWIRRPTQAEWEGMLPPELVQYRNSPEKIPPELGQKYSDITFELMAKVITKPKHDANWWKEHSNLDFIQLFNTHLSTIFEKLSKDTANF